MFLINTNLFKGISPLGVLKSEMVISKQSEIKDMLSQAPNLVINITLPGSYSDSYKSATILHIFVVNLSTFN